MPAPEKKAPQLKNLDALLKQAEEKDIANRQQLNEKDTTYDIIPFSLMDDYPGHRFHLYEGERKDDMVHSIRTKGILQDLILRPKGDGRYHILSGHNRKHCGIEAELDRASCKIKLNLTNEEAWAYVVETNLMQRSFSEMRHTEKAAVIALHYSKMFSQGKRNDILVEIERLENPHGIKENSTCGQSGQKLDSREALAQKYGLSPKTVARYLRIDKLAVSLKILLDDEKIPFIPAIEISFLKESEQEALAQCMELNQFSLNQKKADALREYSEAGKLDQDNIYLILNGELGQKPKIGRAPVVKLSKSVYSKYFKANQSVKEIQNIVEQALKLYFNQK